MITRRCYFRSELGTCTLPKCHEGEHFFEADDKASEIMRTEINAVLIEEFGGDGPFCVSVET